MKITPAIPLLILICANNSSNLTSDRKMKTGQLSTQYACWPLMKVLFISFNSMTYSRICLYSPFLHIVFVKSIIFTRKFFKFFASLGLSSSAEYSSLDLDSAECFFFGFSPLEPAFSSWYNFSLSTLYIFFRTCPFSFLMSPLYLLY